MYRHIFICLHMLCNVCTLSFVIIAGFERERKKRAVKTAMYMVNLRASTNNTKYHMPLLLRFIEYATVKRNDKEKLELHCRRCESNCPVVIFVIQRRGLKNILYVFIFLFLLSLLAKRIQK